MMLSKSCSKKKKKEEKEDDDAGQRYHRKYTLLFLQYPAGSGFSGKAGASMLALQSRRQFVGVNLSTMDLKAD